jgi:hypothetical protein
LKKTDSAIVEEEESEDEDEGAVKLSPVSKPREARFSVIFLRPPVGAREGKEIEDEGEWLLLFVAVVEAETRG